MQKTVIKWEAKMVKQNRKCEVRVITGNAAAAYGVRLCRPDVLASYPITPQTEVVEQLSRFKADGLMDAETIEVEGGKLRHECRYCGRQCGSPGLYCDLLLRASLHV